MNPLTNLDFWLNLGNLFAATAIALFAIKSGYIDKKYDDTKALEDELSSKYDLTHFIDDDIDKKTFKVLNNALDKLAKTSDENDFMAEYSYYDLIFSELKFDLPIDVYPAFEIADFEKLTSNIPPERIIFFVSVFAKFVNKDRDEGSYKLDLLLKELGKIEKFKQKIQEIYDEVYLGLKNDYDREYAFSKDADLKYAQKFYDYRLYILKELMEHDKNYVINTLRKRFEFVEGEYKRLDKIKNKFDRYITNDIILWLFVAGITIQVLSLVFPPTTIATIVAFSPAIVIVIRGLLLLFDEIKPFYEKMILDEDKHKKEDA